MHRVAGSVDVDGVAAGTGAGVELWHYRTAPRTVPEGICLLPLCLSSRVRGFPQRGVFKPGGDGLSPGGSARAVVKVPVRGGKGRQWIRPFSFMASHQIKEMALF